MNIGSEQTDLMTLQKILIFGLLQEDQTAAYGECQW